MTRVGGLVALVALAGGCTSSGASHAFDGGAADGGYPANATRAIEQNANGCPSPPVVLRGTGDAGAPCTTVYECAPTCCPCADANGNPARAWLAAWCSSGACASSDAVCTSTRNDPALCP